MNELLISIEFARPMFLWLLPISLLLICLLFWFGPGRLAQSTTPLQNLSPQTYRHPAINWFRDYAAQQQTRNHYLSFFKRSLGWGILLCLLHISLAQPYRLGARLPDPPSHRDIVFVIDTSVSMVLEDYLVKGQRTSRMRMLQTVMRHFIDQLQIDQSQRNRIGLIVYSEQVYTLVPLTTDYQLLKQQFNRVTPAVLTGRTSNPGKALLYTLAQHQNDTTVEKPTVVLISDVNRPDREIDPRVAAEDLQAHGFRVHSVAIGAGSYAAENKQGTHLVYHPTNYPLLKQIAEHGKGKFFSANDTQNIQRALATIQKSEKRQLETEPQYIKLMLYHWPLLFGIILLSIAQLTQLLRRAR